MSHKILQQSIDTGADADMLRKRSLNEIVLRIDPGSATPANEQLTHQIRGAIAHLNAINNTD
ncbi:hypothetical protein [Arcanobacterium haemolyticum]|uniref:hypothetical protein n=1 Tax=Arcanobacterium haemolyticum TaxID=28264 RepID=UPI000DE58AE2|nr:hypothetical protein [Arcanobacterium haemolyticum]